MMTTDAYLGRALRAVDLAENQSDPGVRASLLEMAEAWLQQAQAATDAELAKAGAAAGAPGRAA